MIPNLQFSIEKEIDDEELFSLEKIEYAVLTLMAEQQNLTPIAKTKSVIITVSL